VTVTIVGTDIATTVGHYIEGKQRSVLGFSHLLKGDRTIIAMGDASGTSR
jgi:hypothetical protein